LRRLKGRRLFSRHQIGAVCRAPPIQGAAKRGGARQENDEPDDAGEEGEEAVDAEPVDEDGLELGEEEAGHPASLCSPNASRFLQPKRRYTAEYFSPPCPHATSPAPGRPELHS